MKKLIFILCLFSGVLTGQQYGLDALGTKFYQLEGCKKLSDGTKCDSCFIMTRGLNGKFARCLHISELRTLLSGSGAGLYGNDTVYLVNNSNGSYTLVNEAGTNYLFGYKFVQSGDTLFLTDQDGTKADTAILTGIGGGNGIYGGSGNIPTGTYAQQIRSETFGIGYFNGFGNMDQLGRGIYMDSDMFIFGSDSANNIASISQYGNGIDHIVSDVTNADQSSVDITSTYLQLNHSDGIVGPFIKLDSDSTQIEHTNIIHLDANGIVLNDLSGSFTGNAGYVWKSNGYSGYWGIDSLGSSSVADGIYNDIEVTGSGLNWEVRDDSISFNKLRNINSDRLLGRDSAGVGNVHELTLGSSLEFTGTNSIQRAALTGDVTATAGSNTLTIANDAVTFAKMQNVTGPVLIGKTTAGSGDLHVIKLGDNLSFSNDTLHATGFIDTDNQKVDSFYINQDTIFISLEDDNDTIHYVILPSVPGTTNTIVLNGNIITSTVNGVSDTTVAILLLNANLSGNSITVNANGITDTTLVIGTNQLTLSSDDLTSIVNGVSSNSIDLSGYLDNTDDQKIDSFYLSNDTIYISLENDNEFTKFIVLPTVPGTTNIIELNGNVLTSTVNGVTDTTVTILTNDLSSSVNTMTSTINGVADGAPIINTIVNGVVGNTLTTTVNGLPASTSVIIKDSLELSGNIMQLMVNGIYDTSLVIGQNTLSYQNPILTSTINGVTDTALIDLTNGTNSIYNASDYTFPDVYARVFTDMDQANAITIGYISNFPADPDVNGNFNDKCFWMDQNEIIISHADSNAQVQGNVVITNGAVAIQGFNNTGGQGTTTIGESFNLINYNGIQNFEQRNDSTEINANLLSINTTDSLSIEIVGNRGNPNDVLFSDGNKIQYGSFNTLIEDTLSLSGNTMTLNVNGVTDTSLVIGELDISSATNTMTVEVNNITDNASIINSNVLNLAGNELTSTINGIADTSLVIGNVTTNFSNSILTTSVNGVSDTALINFTGTGDINQNGNTFGTAVRIGSDDNFGMSLQTNGVGRLYIDSVGVISGQTDGGLVLKGGDAVGDSLVYIPTTADGTDSLGAHVFKVDNNGGTTAMTIRNNGNIGIGTTSPSELVTIGAVSAALATSINSTTGFALSSASGVAFGIENTAASSTASAAGMLLYQNDGAAIENTHRLGYILFGGSSSATALRNATGLTAFAEENWVDGSAYGAGFRFETTTNGGTTRAEKWRIANNGSLSNTLAIGTANLHLKAGTTSASTAPQKFNDGAVMTSSEEGAVEYDSSFYFTNEQRIRFGAGGTIKNHFTDANNVGTGETDLYSYTTAAGTLGRLGETVESKYGGTFNDATATSRLRVYFAGTLIGDTGGLTVTVGSWEITTTIIRTASTTARCLVTIITPTGTPTTYTNQIDLTGLNLGTTNILKITGTATGASGGNDDITAKLGSVKWFPNGIN